MPAFGMAVFKSPPPSRSPSVDNAQPAPSAPPATLNPTTAIASATAAPATAAPATAAATSSPAVGRPAASAAPVPFANRLETADVISQQSGIKRKRGGEAAEAEDHLPSSSKQVRLSDSSTEEHGHAEEASGPTFHLLRSHK